MVKFVVKNGRVAAAVHLEEPMPDHMLKIIKAGWLMAIDHQALKQICDIACYQARTGDVQR